MINGSRKAANEFTSIMTIACVKLGGISPGLQ